MAWSNFAVTLGERGARGRKRRTEGGEGATHGPSTPAPTPTPSLPSLTVGVGAVYYLMRKDMRTGVSQLRRNVKTIRGWLEEEAGSSAAGKGAPPPPPPKKLPEKGKE